MDVGAAVGSTEPDLSMPTKPQSVIGQLPVSKSSKMFTKKPQMAREKLLSVGENGFPVAEVSQNVSCFHLLQPSKTNIVTRARQKLANHPSLPDAPVTFSEISQHQNSMEDVVTLRKPVPQKRPHHVPRKRSQGPALSNVSSQCISDASIAISLPEAKMPETGKTSPVQPSRKKRKVNRSPWLGKKRKRPNTTNSVRNVRKQAAARKTKAKVFPETIVAVEETASEEQVDGNSDTMEDVMKQWKDVRRSDRESRRPVKFLESQQSYAVMSQTKPVAPGISLQDATENCPQEDAGGTAFGGRNLVKSGRVSSPSKLKLDKNRKPTSPAKTKTASREMDTREVQKYIILEHSFLIGRCFSRASNRTTASIPKTPQITKKSALEKVADWFCEDTSEKILLAGRDQPRSRSALKLKLETLEESDEEAWSLPMLDFAENDVGRSRKRLSKSATNTQRALQSNPETLLLSGSSHSTSSHAAAQEPSLEPSCLSTELSAVSFSVTPPLCTQLSGLAALWSPEIWHSATEDVAESVGNLLENDVNSVLSTEASFLSVENHNQGVWGFCLEPSVQGASSASGQQIQEEEPGDSLVDDEAQFERDEEPTEEPVLRQEVLLEDIGPVSPRASNEQQSSNFHLPDTVEAEVIHNAAVQTSHDNDVQSSATVIVKILQYNKTAQQLRVELLSGEVALVHYDSMKKDPADLRLLLEFLDSAYAQNVRREISPRSF